MRLTESLFNFYSLLVLVYCLLSWFPRRQDGLISDLAAVLASIVEPYLSIFRRVIPPIGGMDFSPVAAIIVLKLVEQIVLTTMMSMA
ncbi:YggT family protein [Collinsella sp. AGMB00827]|uniref:YggT family protein n=2 Tax=Collinsella ureilytica TaxID=2869515 RepID=A0ABS7MKW4_9ACTN|nr:YggT family protein [Collinsella urealyticum]MBY4797917.1 YggT family protein [Collinsella urealyticum]